MKELELPNLEDFDLQEFKDYMTNVYPGLSKSKKTIVVTMLYTRLLRRETYLDVFVTNLKSDKYGMRFNEHTMRIFNQFIKWLTAIGKDERESEFLLLNTLIATTTMDGTKEWIPLVRNSKVEIPKDILPQTPSLKPLFTVLLDEQEEGIINTFIALAGDYEDMFAVTNY